MGPGQTRCDRRTGPPLFGRSLGAAVAVEAARRRPSASALILASPFESIAAMSRGLFGFSALAALTTEKYASIDKISSIGMPLLIIHGERDALIPIAQGRALFDRAQEPRRWEPVADADHNDIFERGGERLFSALADFFEGAFGAGEDTAMCEGS